MPYHNVSAYSHYHDILGDESWGSRYDPFARACAWVEAKNIYDVFDHIGKWFGWMQDGTAWNRKPDPDWDRQEYPGKPPLTLALVDRIVEEIDADFEVERGRFPEGIGPEFSRLTGEPRIAFAQEMYKLHLTKAQIREEAKMRLAKGEVLPPPEDAPEALSRQGYSR